MAPVVIFVRHAQALHNLCQDSTMHDPDLSELGREQCLELRESLKSTLPPLLRDNIGLIIASPMRRTLQTALQSMDWLMESGVRILAHSGWQENSDHPCDTGSPPSVLQKEFPQVDFSHLDSVFPEKKSQAGARYRYNKEAILARAQTCLSELCALPDKVVVVVSHSGFLRQGVTGCWFHNADYRIFDLLEGQPGEKCILEQWSLTKTGGLGLSWVEEIEVGQDLPEA